MVMAVQQDPVDLTALNPGPRHGAGRTADADYGGAVDDGGAGDDGSCAVHSAAALAERE
jgi:hypothetical protein